MIKIKIRQFLRKFPVAVRLYNLINPMYMKIKLWLNDFVTATLTTSLKMKLTPLGFNFIGSSLVHHKEMQKGTFEPEETGLFNEYLANFDIFIDVGANIGYYTCLARSLKKHVITVEPQAKNLTYLYANIEGNKGPDVEVFPVGVSDKPGIATLYGGSSTGASVIRSWAGSARIFKQTIAVSTLDILVGDRFIDNKVLIKIDVEGFEYQVLSGSQKLLKMKKKPTWILEITFKEFHPDGINPHYEDIFNMFWKNGYEARTANKENRLIEYKDVAEWIKTGKCESGTFNYKFIPKEQPT